MAFRWSVVSLARTTKLLQREAIFFRSRGSSARFFASYFVFIVRSRNSCIKDPIRSTSSSNAKWPVSRRWSSALGISLLKTSAPFEEFSTLHCKDSIVFAPSDQPGGLLLTEIRLPIGIGIQIPFCVVED